MNTTRHEPGAGGSSIAGQQHSQEELANLYRRRSDAELHLRSLKTHMQNGTLALQNAGNGAQEVYTLLLAYNLVHGIMLKAARTTDVGPHQPSFTGAIQSLYAFLGLVIADSANTYRLYSAQLWMVSTHCVANRPDRIEPRLVKRRPKPYKLLQEPRANVRKRLLKRTSA